MYGNNSFSLFFFYQEEKAKDRDSTFIKKNIGIPTNFYLYYNTQ